MFRKLFLFSNSVTLNAILAFLGCAILSLCSATVVQADPAVIYSARSSFNAASTGNTIITFNGIAAPGSFVLFGVNGSTTLSGVTFTASGGNALFIVDLGFAPTIYNTGSASAGGVLSSQNQISAPAILTIALPSPVTALGFDTNTFPNAVVTVTLSDGEILSYTTIGSTGQFFGFTTSVGITSLILSEPTNRAVAILNIDDFTFGQASAVPEPTTLLLLSTGLLGLASRVRKRKSTFQR
jgi:hypothetical protein